MSKLIRHKWGKYIVDYDICEYCKCIRYWNRDIFSYTYSNFYNHHMYRAPDCKRVYLSDKMP